MRGKTVAGFRSDLLEYVKKTNIALDTAVKKIVFDLHKAAIERSPWRTGRFRASWGISPSSIPLSDEGAPPSASGDPNSVPISETQTRMNVAASGIGTLWFIYNNLLYAQSLEEGHSQKAPHGILRIAIADVEAEIVTIFNKELGGIKL